MNTKEIKRHSQIALLNELLLNEGNTWGNIYELKQEMQTKLDKLNYPDINENNKNQEL